MMYKCYYNDELYHYGVKGMKWGVRRYRESVGEAKRKRKQRDDRIQSRVYKEESRIEAKYRKGEKMSDEDMYKTFAADARARSDWKDSRKQYRQDKAEARKELMSDTKKAIGEEANSIKKSKTFRDISNTIVGEKRMRKNDAKATKWATRGQNGTARAIGGFIGRGLATDLGINVVTSIAATHVTKKYMNSSINEAEYYSRIRGLNAVSTALKAYGLTRNALTTIDEIDKYNRIRSN